MSRMTLIDETVQWETFVNICLKIIKLTEHIKAKLRWRRRVRIIT